MSRASAWRTIKGIEAKHNNPHIRRGLDGEAGALRLYDARHGLKTASCGFVVHPELSWLGASPDGLVGQCGLVEIKCPAKLPKSVPDYHLIQMAVQLACTGRQWCDYFAVANGEIFEKRVVRHLESECAMLNCLWQFYQEFVATGLPPPRMRQLPAGPARSPNQK